MKHFKFWDFFLIIFFTSIISLFYIDKQNIKIFPNTTFLFAGRFDPIPIKFHPKKTFTPPDHILTSESLYTEYEQKHLIYVEDDFIKHIDRNEIWDKKKFRIRDKLFNKFQATHLTLTNVYANNHGSWACDGNAISLPYSEYDCPSHLRNLMDLSAGNITVEVDEAILISHWAALHNICHILCDVLTPMMMLPNDLTNNTYIIGNFSYGNIKELFTTIGFRESQLLAFGGDADWFYAKKLHVLTKYRPLMAYSGPPCETLRKKFEDALSLNNIKPFIYSFINRTSRDRMISNFPEIKQEAENMFPHINWEIMKDSVCSVK